MTCVKCCHLVWGAVFSVRLGITNDSGTVALCLFNTAGAAPRVACKPGSCLFLSFPHTHSARFAAGILLSHGESLCLFAHMLDFEPALARSPSSQRHMNGRLIQPTPHEWKADTLAVQETRLHDRTLCLIKAKLPPYGWDLFPGLPVARPVRPGGLDRAFLWRCCYFRKTGAWSPFHGRARRYGPVALS